MKKYSKIISLVTVVVMMITLLTGCGEIKNAEKTVTNTFEALKALDFDNAQSYLDVDGLINSEDSSLSIDDIALFENLFSKLEYEIISSEKIDKNTVIVKTKISAVDMKPVFTDFITKAFQYALANAFGPQLSDEDTDKKMMEIFIECTAKEDLEMVTTEVDIKVVKVDKKWKIDSDETFADAVLGGFSSALEDMQNYFQ